MSEQSWCQEDLDALNAAIAQGTLRVQYGDKLIEYRSLNDMLRTRSIIMSDLGLANPRGGRKFAEFDKGLK